MSLTIGGITVPHAAILAPMSGVTDMPFRRAVRRAGGGLVVTETVSYTHLTLPTIAQV